MGREAIKTSPSHSMAMISLPPQDGNRPDGRLVHTYSIVARDPESGDLGVAVQSHWFSVGTVVAWARSGVGAVATQAMANPSFGPQGLTLMGEGKNACEAVQEVLDADIGREFRQLAMIDSNGDCEAYTGAKCVAAAGHIVGDGFIVQANMMRSDRVWKAMAEAFTSSRGPLAERMLMALEAAEASGGDIRGSQSACLLVVRGRTTGDAWKDKLVDLRVDDAPDPIWELRRLLKVHRAYERMNQGDEALENGNMKLAMEHYSTAEAMFPENEEMAYWHAVTLANIGEVKASLPIFQQVFKVNADWKEMTPRLVPAGLLRVSPADLKKILGQ